MKISVIGAGNMGGAIAKGLYECGGEYGITVSDIDSEKLSVIKNECVLIHTQTDFMDKIGDANVIVLAVKPWLIGEVIEKMSREVDLNNQIVVSIAAGISLADLRELFRVSAESSPLLFRVMPNIAIEYCESINFIAHEQCAESKAELVHTLFSKLGLVMTLKESLFGAATALGSCGVAFAMRYVRASAMAGLEGGLTAEQSQKIMVQTLKGVVKLLESSDRHIESLIDSVCTPGGITIKGLNKMEDEGFTRAVQAAIRMVR